MSGSEEEESPSTPPRHVPKGKKPKSPSAFVLAGVGFGAKQEGLIVPEDSKTVSDRGEEVVECGIQKNL